MRVTLGEPIVHLVEELGLVLEPLGELAHVGLRGLRLEPELGVRADHVLDAVGVEQHEHEVRELGVHREGLVLLCRARDVDAVLRLALGDKTRRPARDHTHGRVDREDDLRARLPDLGVGQPAHPLDGRVQVLDGRVHRRHRRVHPLRPGLPVLAALVEVLAVRPVAADHSCL